MKEVPWRSPDKRPRWAVCTTSPRNEKDFNRIQRKDRRLRIIGPWRPMGPSDDEGGGKMVGRPPRSGELSRWRRWGKGNVETLLFRRHGRGAGCAGQRHHRRGLAK